MLINYTHVLYFFLPAVLLLAGALVAVFLAAGFFLAGEAAFLLGLLDLAGDFVALAGDFWAAFFGEALLALLGVALALAGEAGAAGDLAGDAGLGELLVSCLALVFFGDAFLAGAAFLGEAAFLAGAAFFTPAAFLAGDAAAFLAGAFLVEFFFAALAAIL